MELSGVTLTIVGMGIVFLALGLLALIAWGLERVFRVDTEAEPHKPESTMEAVVALALAYHTKRKGSVHIHHVNESVWIQQTRVYE